MPVLSLAAAGWPLDLRTVIPVMVLSVVFGFLLSRSHYNELLALMMSGIYGVGFVLLLAAINEPGNLGEGAISVFSRLFRWMPTLFRAASTRMIWFLRCWWPRCSGFSVTTWHGIFSALTACGA